MTIEVLRRTFAAAKHPPGSEERARLNRDTLTSEYYTSHPRQHCVCRTFTTKAQADAYVSTQRARPIVRVAKVEQVDMFANQGGLFAHVAQPGELE